MKRDSELQKPDAHTSIWLGKRENDVKRNVWCPKSQRLTHKIEISKISSIDFIDVMIQKIIWYDVYGAKWKASKLYYQVYVGGYICIFL